MPRHGTVVDLRRPLTDHDRLGNERLAAAAGTFSRQSQGAA
jgi:hypothetical protein